MITDEEFEQAVKAVADKTSSDRVAIFDAFMEAFRAYGVIPQEGATSIPIVGKALRRRLMLTRLFPPAPRKLRNVALRSIARRRRAYKRMTS